MLSLSLEQVARTVDGTLVDVPDPSAPVTAPLSNDTRTVQPGGLFACLSGERADGHAYADDAVAAGATAVLATRTTGAPAIVVTDVLAAMAALASDVIGRLPDTTVVALTGSVGKTTTKDLLAQVLDKSGPTIATERSFNNEIGLPITVTRADVSTRYLLLEMGARGVGHIRHLTDIASPRISAVLCIGTAHLGEFGSRETTAAAKGEIIEALPSGGDGGIAVLNADDRLVVSMARRTQARVVMFGRSPEADIRATNITVDDRGRPAFTLVTSYGTDDVQLQIHGEHQITNALAAVSLALAAGVDYDTVVDSISEARILSSGRMQVTERRDGITIVNDAYNANPDSMTASFSAFAAMRTNGRRFAVLGEMYEIGGTSGDDHATIGRQAAESGISHLVTVGGIDAERMSHAAASHGAVAAEHVTTKAEVAPWLVKHLQPGDMVLVKGGNALGLETVVRELIDV